MPDLPDAAALLALARDVLVKDLLPLLPPERRLDARLVANCMAIAEREAAAEDAVFATIVLDVSALISNLTSALPPSGGEREGAAKREGEGRRPGDRTEAPPTPTEGHPELLRRFARELRNGGFEKSPQRAAEVRAILWRLTVARLRLANPRFLAANGFS